MSELIYKLIDRKTGEAVVSGTAKECANRLDCTEENIRKACRSHRAVLLRLDVYEVAEADQQVKTPAEEWDDFMRPIRERFGIPVKRVERRENHGK